MRIHTSLTTELLFRRFLLFVMFFLLSIPSCLSQKSSIPHESGKIAISSFEIDVDEIEQFNLGVAIVKKNSKYALIDSHGKFVVPFGKYSEIFSIPDSRILLDERTLILADGCGIFEVKDTGSFQNGGFINYRGKAVFRPHPNSDYINQKKSIDHQIIGVTQRTFTSDGVICYEDIFFDAEGHRLYLSSPSNATWNEGIGCYQDFNTKLYGYVDLAGKIIIPPQYDYAEPFYDSLARVIGKNGLDHFVNTKNVAPFKGDFISERTHFTNGLITVLKLLDDKYYLLNKLGMTAFPHDTLLTHHFMPNYRIVGCRSYTFGVLKINEKNDCAIDKNGILYTENDLLQSLGADTGVALNFLYNFKGQFFCTDSTRSKYGILDFDKHIYIPPIFSRISMFDNVSGLAYAKIVLSEGKYEFNSIYREGYINSDGLFVIVLKPGK